jgi:hypothetical protein
MVMVIRPEGIMGQYEFGRKLGGILKGKFLGKYFSKEGEKS